MLTLYLFTSGVRILSYSEDKARGGDGIRVPWWNGWPAGMPLSASDSGETGSPCSRFRYLCFPDQVGGGRKKDKVPHSSRTL